MKTSKRTTAILLAALLVFSTTVPALAAGDGTGALAEETPEPSAKEEVIYVTLDAAGGPVSAYAVNSFPGGEITDYGDYDSVRVLNTSDPIEYKNGVVNITTDAKRIYYQGEFKNVELPWEIALTYKLDGRDVTAEEIAGRSGQVEIRFTVTKNERCSGSFYDDYALQANFTLPGGVFSGISAPDATVAAVGADRQLTYTLLPGEGIDTVITAAADGFSLPAVSINGIYLNLNVDIDAQDIRPGWPPRQCNRTAQQRRKRALHRQRSTARRRGRAAGRFDKPPERHSRARRRRRRTAGRPHSHARRARRALRQFRCAGERRGTDIRRAGGDRRAVERARFSHRR